MNTNKTVLGGIVGGVAFFFVGWAVWGILLDSYYNQHNGCPGFMRTDDEMMGKMLWMVLSNLASGFMLAIVFGWANVGSATDGAKYGAIIGLLNAMSFNFGFYAMSNMFDSLNPHLVDTISSAAVFGVIGGIIGWIMNRGNTAE